MNLQNVGRSDGSKEKHGVKDLDGELSKNS